MLGARSACKLPCGRRAAWGALPVAAGATRRTAVEDRLAALESCAGRKIAGAGFNRRQDRRLVNRPRACLRHNHAASGRRGSGCRLAPARMRVGGRGLGCNGGHRSFRPRCFLGSFRNRNGVLKLSAGRRGCQRRFNCGWGFCRGSWMCGDRGRSLGGCDRLFSGARVVFLAGGRRRLDHDYRTCNGNSACGSLGYHRTCGRAGSNGRGSRGLNDRRRGAGLGNNLARFRSGRGCGRSRRGNNWRRWSRTSSWRRGRSDRWPRRRMCVARLFLFFPLLGQNGLEHVARLGDMREVYLWRYGLVGARGRGAGVAGRARSMFYMRAYLLCFVRLQRAGVGLACAQAEFRQNVKNLPAVDFHLAREIVDTNLTHPPLFKNSLSKALSRS